MQPPGERSYLSVWAGQPVLRTVSVVVRAIRRPGAGIHGHMAESVGAVNVIRAVSAQVKDGVMGSGIGLTKK